MTAVLALLLVTAVGGCGGDDGGNGGGGETSGTAETLDVSLTDFEISPANPRVESTGQVEFRFDRRQVGHQRVGLEAGVSQTGDQGPRTAAASVVGGPQVQHQAIGKRVAGEADPRRSDGFINHWLGCHPLCYVGDNRVGF